MLCSLRKQNQNTLLHFTQEYTATNTPSTAPLALIQQPSRSLKEIARSRTSGYSYQSRSIRSTMTVGRLTKTLLLASMLACTRLAAAAEVIDMALTAACLYVCAPMHSCDPASLHAPAAASNCWL